MSIDRNPKASSFLLFALGKLCNTPSSRGAVFSREALAPWWGVSIHRPLIYKGFRLLHFVRNDEQGLLQTFLRRSGFLLRPLSSHSSP